LHLCSNKPVFNCDRIPAGSGGHFMISMWWLAKDKSGDEEEESIPSITEI